MIDKLKEIKEYCEAASGGSGSINYISKENFTKEKIDNATEALRDSIFKSINYDGGHAYTWISTDDGVIIAYFGNGPTSMKNAELWANAKQDLPKLVAALEVAVEVMEYSIGPTRDIKTPKIKEALKQIESILGGE